MQRLWFYLWLSLLFIQFAVILLGRLLKPETLPEGDDLSDELIELAKLTNQFWERPHAPRLHPGLRRIQRMSSCSGRRQSLA